MYLFAYLFDHPLHAPPGASLTCHASIKAIAPKRAIHSLLLCIESAAAHAAAITLQKTHAVLGIAQRRELTTKSV